MERLQTLLDEGRSTGVFSQARAVVLRDGRVRFDGGSAPREARFDLASVTKVMSTTAIFCRLAAEGVVAPGTRLQALLPTAKADVTLEDLLFHRSGLPAFVPFFAPLVNERPALLGVLAGGARAETRARVVRGALEIAPTQPVGAQAVYSDVGFLLLGEALAAAAQRPLEQLFDDEVALPLGLRTAGFRPLSRALPPKDVVPTGGTRPREPAPGQEGLWQVTPGPSRDGEVDDDNAWVMNGVAGHAGLFASATDVARFGQAVLEGQVRPPTPWARDTTPGSTRALGFDTPSAEGASCGPRFGKGALALGHLGFTGTSLWVDFGHGVVVALLTNRVISGRANVAIRAFRPRFHEAVVDALGLEPLHTGA
jgi:CubicO group peptidase (beta-lactamase class C family)